MASVDKLGHLLDLPTEARRGVRLPGATGGVRLEARDLTVRSASGRALSGVTLRLAGGGRLAIHGASGSGKSALVDALTGVRTHGAGRIYISGAKDFGPIYDRKLLKPELELALILDIPIFTRVQDGRFQAAQANLSRLEQQTRFARDRLTADVRDATSAIAMSQERIVATAREVATSRQLVEMERQRFELGEGTLLLVNLREQSLAEARQREVDALADYFKALASQRAAVGGPHENRL